VLTALPVGPANPGQTAGPTFDIARPRQLLLPHQDAAWKIIKERLDVLEQACASLSQRAGLGALAPLAEKLQSMSHGHRGTRLQNGQPTDSGSTRSGPARASTGGRDVTMTNPAVFTTTFLAAAVEIIVGRMAMSRRMVRDGSFAISGADRLAGS